MSQERPPWRWCWRREGRGRRPKPRFIGFQPSRVIFVPLDESGRPVNNEPIYINPDELEALRLVYYLGLTQEEAAKKMGISRGTLWRALSSGRKKLVSALVERRPLILMLSSAP
ncbi:MAG: DUF134 domain-containing protein [Desulfurococcales archaeon]|nr:DUF134 domain-containing protein [Desulfurococcales archaeon]